MKFFNATPHPINIIRGSQFNPAIRKNQGGEVALSIPSDGILSAKTETVSLPPQGGVPIFENKFTGVDALPEGYDGYIVSVMYASAYSQTHKEGSPLYTIHGLVVGEDGKTPIGCLGLQKWR